MKLVEPKVFLIGRTCTNPGGVREWLTELGISPQTIDKYINGISEYSPGESLVQLAGKRCYNAFEIGHNKNITKVRENIKSYIDNILSSGHGCYDEETEVLTKDGWKKWTEVNFTTQFATLIDNGIQYEVPLALQNYSYSGPMYRVDSPGVDLLVTPNHRMYVNKTTTSKGRRREDYAFIEAEKLESLSHSYRKNVPNINLEAGFHLPHPLMELLGFAIGDGYYHEKILSFHLKRERKIKYLREICKSLKIELREDKNNFQYNLTVPNEYVEYFENIYNKYREKIIPPDLLHNMSGATLVSLYGGLISADGSVSRTGVIYDTTSPTLAGQFQHLCLLIGLSANISQAPCYRERKNSFGEKPIYRLHIVRRNNDIEVNKKSSVGKGKTYWVENWKGQVYCCTIPNGLLYVRRNGKPVWCGNSVLEHVTYNFAIENVSRVFTSEFNRHRAGMALSEGSLRYIRYSDIPFWVPTSLAFNPQDSPSLTMKKRLTKALFIEAFGQMEKNYKKLEQIWELDTDTSLSFTLKKQLTSLFRRIIGMGVATGGVWTGNLRALRHICELRSEPHVEEEMILVVSMILNILLQYESNIFGDFSFEKGYWMPKYRKV